MLWVVAVRRLPVVHCRTALPPVTGPRNPACLNLNSRTAVCSLCICCITFNVTSFQLQGNICMLSCFPSHNITMTRCALSFCPGTKPERPRSTRSSFCAAPQKCNAAEHSLLLLASQCLRRVKSALVVHWESAAGPQTPGKLSPTCLPRPSYPARPLGIFSFEQRFTMGKCETVRCMVLWDILL